MNPSDDVLTVTELSAKIPLLALSRGHAVLSLPVGKALLKLVQSQLVHFCVHRVVPQTSRLTLSRHGWMVLYGRHDGLSRQRCPDPQDSP